MERAQDAAAAGRPRHPRAAPEARTRVQDRQLGAVEAASAGGRPSCADGPAARLGTAGPVQPDDRQRPEPAAHAGREQPAERGRRQQHAGVSGVSPVAARPAQAGRGTSEAASGSHAHEAAAAVGRPAGAPSRPLGVAGARAGSGSASAAGEAGRGVPPDEDAPPDDAAAGGWSERPGSHSRQPDQPERSPGLHVPSSPLNSRLCFCIVKFYKFVGM